MNQVDLRLDIQKILSTLTPREEIVLTLRFGLKGYSDHTLEEIAHEMSSTRERIRQIEAKALRKIRHPSRANGIRFYSHEKFGMLKMKEKKKSDKQKQIRQEKELRAFTFLSVLDVAGIEYKTTDGIQYRTGDCHFWPRTARWTHKYYNSRFEYKDKHGNSVESLFNFLKKAA